MTAEVNVGSVSQLDAAKAAASAKLADKAHDIDTLIKAVNDAAAVSATLWFGWILFLFYLALTAQSVTQRDLFMANPLTLPVLNVALPLLGFFFLAPILIVVSHVYVMIHFNLLGIKARRLDAELRAQSPDSQIDDDLRQQLVSNVIVQALAGAADTRKGVLGLLLGTIMWTTLVLAPWLVLLLLDLKFLPYRDLTVLWLTRGALLADIAMVWFFADVLRGEEETEVGRAFVTAMQATASVVLIGIVLFVAKIPGEPVSLAGELTEGPFANTIFAPGIDVTTNSAVTKNPTGHVSVQGRDLRHAVLTGAKLEGVDFTAADLSGATLNDSDLAGAVFGCPDQIFAASCHPAMLTGVDLSNADLRGATLRFAVADSVSLAGARLDRVDFTGAYLTNAGLRGATAAERTIFVNAHMNGADLGQAALESPDLTGADLQKASGIRARLNGALAQNAMMQGAQFGLASLDDADLRGAHLEQAGLSGTSLDGSSLYGAHLAGAVLREASLIGASLDYADLVAADLYHTDLRGASLANANLNGAALDVADLRGAYFRDARLQGVDMIGARIQGASFEGAHMQAVAMSTFTLEAVSFDSTYLWRAQVPVDVVANASRIGSFSATFADLADHDLADPERDSVSTWSHDDYLRIVKQITDATTPGDFQTTRLKSAARLDPNDNSPALDTTAAWTTLLALPRPDQKTYFTAVSKAFGDIVCDVKSDSNLIRGLLNDGGGLALSQLVRLKKSGAATIDRFLAVDTCPATGGLSDAEKAKLKLVRLDIVQHPAL